MRSQSGARAPASARAGIPFRSVNRPGSEAHDPALQRHHVLPRQLLVVPSFDAMFEAIGHDRIGFEDFRRNGLLLPAKDCAAMRMGLPLHRGPHRDYNEMVIEKVSEIEQEWQQTNRSEQDLAGLEALRKLAGLQDSLKEQLLSPERSQIKLNSKDPLGDGLDYKKLDEMADALWDAT